MAAPVVGAGSKAVSVVFQPPLEFIAKQFGRFHSELSDFENLWDRFEVRMEDIENEQFDTQGQGQWPPLAESTLAQKSAHGWPLDPLIRTGELKDSVTTTSRAAKRHGQSMEWGTDVPYAGYHQDGGYVAGRPPKREIIPDLNDATYRRGFEQDMVSWINEAARRSGFGLGIAAA